MKSKSQLLNWLVLSVGRFSKPVEEHVCGAMWASYSYSQGCNYSSWGVTNYQPGSTEVFSLALKISGY